MPFKSEAQRRYFYYKASQPGEEGKKWKKHLRKYKESTPKGVKLPERVKTAASGLRSRLNVMKRSPTEYAVQVLGEDVGRVAMKGEGDSRRIMRSELTERLQGMGLGKKIYAEIAKQEGGILRSDENLSAQAAKLWDKIGKDPSYITSRHKSTVVSKPSQKYVDFMKRRGGANEYFGGPPLTTSSIRGAQSDPQTSAFTLRTDFSPKRPERVKTAGERTDEVLAALKSLWKDKVRPEHLKAWSRHAALNLGQASDSARRKEGKDALKEAIFAALPPTHHSTSDMKAMMRNQSGKKTKHRDWYKWGRGDNVPEPSKTASETYYHGSRYKIRKLRKGAYVTPYKEDALSFAVPWSTDDLEYAGGPDGRPPSKLKFKKRPPRDHKIYLYKVKAPVKKAKTNTGVSYDWNRVTTSAADLELVKTIPSWKKELLVKTASRAKGLAKFRHMTRDIQSLADTSLHSPDVLLWRSIGRDGPIERRIVIGAPVEYQGARFKTPFYSSTGTGSENVQLGEMIPFNWVEGKKPSADRGRKKGQGLWINKYFAKKQPPPGHPLHLQKLRLEAMDRKGLLTPTHVIDEYEMGAGRRYAGPLAVNAWLRERGHHRTLLPAVESDLQSILKYIEGRTMTTKTSAVKGPVKQYRRALQLLEERVPMHGTSHANAASIARSGQLNTGSTNFFGPGTYWSADPSSYGMAQVAKTGDRSMIEKITDPRAAGDWSIHRTQVGTPIGSKDTIINRGGRGRKVEEMRAAARAGKVRFIDSYPFQTAGLVRAGSAEPDMKKLIDRVKRQKKIDAKIRKKRAAKTKTAASALRSRIKVVKENPNLYKVLLSGQEIGRVDIDGKGSQRKISLSKIDKRFQRMGIGKKVYAEIAKQEGGILRSDDTLLPPAARLWDKFKTDPSYTVLTNPSTTSYVSSAPDYLDNLKKGYMSDDDESVFILGTNFGGKSRKKKGGKMKSASQVAFDYGFFLEMDKISEELSKKEKVIYVLPSVGAAAGAAYGMSSPHAFSPEAMFPKYIKKVGLKSKQGRALSALLGAGTMGTVAGFPAMLYDTAQILSDK